MPINSPESVSAAGVPAPLISMRGISKTFHSAAGNATVLKGIDMDILVGQFVSIVGRSGSGKSTLVNMITGIDKPTSGSVAIADRSILSMSESAMAVWRGKTLGVVFQFFQLLPMLTLLENVMLPMDFCNVFPPAAREDRAMNLLHRVGLGDLAFSLPGAVSGGQQQSAAVARALANDPPILIADEPTGNLDSVTAEQVMQIFEELADQNKTILMVTHDPNLAQRTQRRLIIADGELINESLSTAFPLAPHSLLLKVSRSIKTFELAPNTPISSLESGPDLIFLITEGTLQSGEIPADASHGSGFLVDPLEEPGGLFSGAEGASLLGFSREDALEILASSDSEPSISGLHGQTALDTLPYRKRDKPS